MTKGEIKKLDKIWSAKVKEDALYRCEITGKKGDECQLHPHHFITRKNRSTRWYLPNGICLSAGKHTMEVVSAHGHPEWFRKQMLDIRGDKWLKDVVRQANKVFKGTYKEVLDYLEGKTNNYC